MKRETMVTQDQNSKRREVEDHHVLIQKVADDFKVLHE